MPTFFSTVNGPTDDLIPKVEFLSLAAHELRAPLANIRSYAEVTLAQAQNLDARTKRALETILRNADTALNRTRDLFDWLRLEQRGAKLSFDLEQVEALLNHLKERAGALARPKNVDVSVFLADALPPVACDYDRLSEALWAMTQWLIQHAEPGSTLTLRASATPEKTTFGVLAPTAAAPPQWGNDEALHRHLVRSKKLEPALSLAVARAVIEAHGGTVSWQSGTSSGWVIDVKSSAH
jgi:signal transduction histidine kinase